MKLMNMPHFPVARFATHRIEATPAIMYCVLRHLGMTAYAIGLNNLLRTAASLNLERDLLESKGPAVMEPVVSFGVPFPDKVVRDMAVVTDRNVLVPALRPAFIYRIHNVAILAGIRVVAKIRKPFGIDKRI